MPLFDKAFLRELFWVTRPYVRKPATAEGQSALRLSRGIGYPCWRADVDVVLAKVWDINSFGFYTSSLRAQAAIFCSPRVIVRRSMAWREKSARSAVRRRFTPPTCGARPSL